MGVRISRPMKRAADLSPTLVSGRVSEREGALEDLGRQAKSEAEEARRRHATVASSRPAAVRRVRMLVTRKGSPDGVRSVLYEAGSLHSLPEALAVPWIARGFAEEEKSVERAPELK